MVHSGAVVTRRGLGRSAMQRQHLLDRATATPLSVVRLLVAVQAQEAKAPYLGLWTRVQGFDHPALTSLLEDRSVVRSTLLRGTQHIVAAEDYPWLRGLLQPSIRGRLGPFVKATRHLLDQLPAAVEEVLSGGQVLTRPQVGRALARRWPDVDPLALGWAAQAVVPIVHPPTSRTWERPAGPTPFALAADWIGRGLDPKASPQRLVHRYLVAFGPATVADIQTWSGLTRLTEVVQDMGAGVRRVHDEDGRELVDLPDATVPDPDIPAPPRFLPEFDNLILAYADRTRLMDDDVRRRVCIGSVTLPTLLVDGRVVASWSVRADGGRSVLDVAAFRPIPSAHRAPVEEEGMRLLGILSSGDEGDVRIRRADA